VSSSLDDVLSDLPPEEADELRSLLGELETPGLPVEGSARPGIASGVPWVSWISLLFAVLAFGVAAAYAPVTDAVFTDDFKVQSNWTRTGSLAGAGIDFARLKVGEVYHSQARDPWEHAYRMEYQGAAQWRIHSHGPNGEYEEGVGDDVAVERSVGWSAAFVWLHGDAIFALFGLALAWFGAAAHVVRLPLSRDSRVENWRAIGILTLPALVTWIVGSFYGKAVVELMPQRFVAPPAFVLWGTVTGIYAVAFFTIKAVRAR
jgi:hypothetical protein